MTSLGLLLTFMVVMSDCILEIDDISRTEKSPKGKNMYSTLKEEDINLLETTCWTSLTLTLEGKNSKNQYVNKTEVLACQCRNDALLQLCRKLEIQWNNFETILTHWTIVFICSSTCLVSLILFLNYKEYQSKKQYEKNAESAENRYNSVNFDYRQIQS
jgi:hypothetical protein